MKWSEVTFGSLNLVPSRNGIYKKLNEFPRLRLPNCEYGRSYLALISSAGKRWNALNLVRPNLNQAG